MLRITLHDRSRELRMKLEGKLSGPWVAELRQCWRTASSTTAGRATSVDLGEVDFVDAEGRTLLADMHEQGVRLDAATPLIRALLGEALSRAACATVEATAVGASHGFFFRGKSRNR
jgi:ABC-type transporter Mla MlaB component